MSSFPIPRSARRAFLSGASAIGTVAMLGLPVPAAAEPPPETTRIRLVHGPYVCFAPLYLSEELLRLEGFSQIPWML
jgi:NitT/TauT family transport system substrate-binding protein